MVTGLGVEIQYSIVPHMRYDLRVHQAFSVYYMKCTENLRSNFLTISKLAFGVIFIRSSLIQALDTSKKFLWTKRTNRDLITNLNSIECSDKSHYFFIKSKFNHLRVLIYQYGPPL